jgi:hypothetical protein
MILCVRGVCEGGVWEQVWLHKLLRLSLYDRWHLVTFKLVLTELL